MREVWSDGRQAIVPLIAWQFTQLHLLKKGETLPRISA